MSVVLDTIFIFLDLFESLAQFLKLFFLLTVCVCVYPSFPWKGKKKKTIVCFHISLQSQLLVGFCLTDDDL